MSREVKRSVCPYDCPDACGLLVEVEGGLVAGVRGDTEHPNTRGVLCPKMVHYEKTVHSAERVIKPLLRTGPKGSGSFAEISWPEAIDRIVVKWREICVQYGAEAILPASYAGTMGLLQRNCGHAFFYKLGASQLERTLCSSAKEYGWKAVMGATQQSPPDEAAKSDFIILWGSHALASNIHFLHPVREAKKNGARILVIDTYVTETAAAVADQTILIRPGTDGALALGMMQVLASEGMADREFIEKYVQGFDRLEKEILPRYTPAATAAITGIKAEVAVELARAYGKARAPFIREGSGLFRYANGAMTTRLITSLPAVVGAWAKNGGGAIGNISTAAAFDLRKVTREDFMTTLTRSVSINQMGDALNNLNSPPIQSLYVYCSNPVAVYPDQNSVIRGLQREELFTVVHERFMTDTALYADIILPATTSVEHADVYRSYGHYGVQRVKACIPPVGEAKSNWDTFCLLATAMGFDEPFFRQSEEGMLDEFFREPTAWMAEVDQQKLQNGESVTLPLSADYRLNFRTPSGKIEILNPAEQTSLPDWFPPYGGPGEFCLMTSPSLYSLNSSFNEQKELVEKKSPMSLAINPAEATRLGLTPDQRVVAFNELGEVTFILKTTDRVPPGVAVADGVAWLRDAPGDRTINALTSQRLTDCGRGSTFYDTRVEIKKDFIPVVAEYSE